ncbi:LLM class F420-dependent oxidoreductase [Actinacidiphila guanduensis]|uniref:Probable F420-dependent oxidoreductase, Rv3520c family n=1 Tax=Actinacidiphila guanduensis TaxID=310781 RepID=A0A1H0B964_9ACTN|nr:LLM class F420-dependent oxidoreductase [Actinacidiphila guanduensis]SDN41893.1 probable F420-dependent oxidoreductase, Rv3520c family [Actinacidiphila guanduensis]
MRIGMQLEHRRGFLEAVAELRDLERAGLGTVSVAELYSFDAVSQLGYLAAVTDHLEIASGILPIYSRTPALTAMTAAGLDYVSGGRFTLGLGVSGPQVIEGFHGVPYDAPLARTREVVEICRAVWRRETLAYEGRHYRLPLGPGEGTGLGKPLKLLNRPVRERIPVMIAAIGPRNTALAAEIAEVWEPAFFHPERAEEVFGAALAQGLARRAPELGALRVHVDAPAAIGEDVADALDQARLRLAHYIGGMGARGRNFYFDLACRYGHTEQAERIQDLYLDGRRREAAAAVPEALVRGVSLIGTCAEVADRVAAFAAAGVTTLSLSPMGRATSTPEARVRLVEQIAAMAG